MNAIGIGQRWINHARPELGLGIVVKSQGRTATLCFGIEQRDHVFALESAPLARIRFSPGDLIRTSAGIECAIDQVVEQEGLLVYIGRSTTGEEIVVVETEITPTQSFNRPIERLLHGQVDDKRWFSLRYRTLLNRFQLYDQPLWGMLGGRTALLPHQLYVAHEVAGRHAPRVLLADEVGLGKTIEAGLIAHFQITTERAHRVLIVVPESLVHQWLVEMLRRFNLMFRVFDGERCAASDEGGNTDNPEVDRRRVNPFLEEQLVIVSREFLVAAPLRLQQCRDAGWDLTIVDEVHHLHWSPEGASDAYDAVETLARVSSGILLLTGTPRQMGMDGHFARLRLLDPARYYDLAKLESEHEGFLPVADLVEKLSAGDISGADEAELTREYGIDVTSPELDLETGAGRDRVIDRLLDRYGTGRVMFRNTRASVKGFPDRRLHPHPLAGSTAAILEHASGEEVEVSLSGLLCPEIASIHDYGAEQWGKTDPKVTWLTEWLLARPEQKALVICSTQATATAISMALKQDAGIRTAVFHEGLSLLERDRAAAWFAETEAGCQVLVCSEIGSEGRNFQFAHNLVLFDLPLAPDLLEQRIGRLDRIGRRTEVDIHVPYLAGTAQERLFHWFHQGLDAFERSGSVNQLVFEQLGNRLEGWLRGADNSSESMIDDTAVKRRFLEQEMRDGRDKLLEFHSCRPGKANALVEEAEHAGVDSELREWLDQAFDCYDIGMEPYRQNSVLLKPGPRLVTSIPSLPDEGLAATFHRHTALENEDLHYLSWEHPLAVDIADLVLNTERGNTALCGIRHGDLGRGKLAIECIFVIEAAGFVSAEVLCRVPPLLEFAVFHEDGRRLGPGLDHNIISAGCVELKSKLRRQIIRLMRRNIQVLLELGISRVETDAAERLQQHASTGIERLQEELSRLEHLRLINSNVREDEIGHLEKLLEEVKTAVARPRVRLDSLRVLVGL